MIEDHRAWAYACPDCGRIGTHADSCTMFPGEHVEHGNRVEIVPPTDYQRAVDAIKALPERVRDPGSDPREAAYAHGYRTAVADALEALIGGRYAASSTSPRKDA